ncbi:MAG: lysophospholipase [Spirochaetaceae bacterium]|jgi:alpha-beta hydrolase superfamily lysophospholipase|nr:lysophospholipase [Spirochaetaceae bacterium]
MNDPLTITADVEPVENRFSSSDSTAIFYRRWTCPAPRAALHLVHGMAEHSLRYDRLARRLAGRGIEVWAADMRGHGKTADRAVNDPGTGGQLGHAADTGAENLIMNDLSAMNRMIRGAVPRKPLFMLGHSWGSFLTQLYIEEHGNDIDGCILSGTRGPGGFKVAAGGVVLALIALCAGARRPVELSRALSDGPFNRPFRPNRTSFDWLSRDEAEVDAYIADPVSGMLASAGFYRDLIALLRRIHLKENIAAIRKNLPVYVYAGSEDPVGDMGAGPAALIEAYRQAGLTDLELTLYPGARHEMHNETNREEMTGNLVAWLEKHIA